jgi:hypothetical protein
MPEISDIKSIGIVLAYFNLVTFAAIVYLKFYAINPKCGEGEQSWGRYMMSEQFKDFLCLYERSFLDPWYKRNFALFYSLHNALIVVVYFWSSVFMYLLLLIEFLFLFMIVTIRPFSHEFYMNVKIVCRLLFLTLYIFMVVGNLYYSMGDLLFNSNTVASFLVARASIFLFLIATSVIIIAFEIYFKCSNLSYHIKVVK